MAKTRLLKRIRVKMNAFSQENPNSRGFIWRFSTLFRKVRYRMETLFVKRNEKMIIFDSFGGRFYNDSPRVIYETILNDSRFDDFTFVWAIKKKDKYMKKFEAEHPRTRCIPFGGKTCRKYWAMAKYWVSNFKLPDYLEPKKDQRFLQTWHGTPLKKLGMDWEHFDNAALSSMEEMKKRYLLESKKISYFVAPSDFAAEKIISAWNLAESGLADIVHVTGYPRNDFLQTYTAEDVYKSKLSILGYWYLMYEKEVKGKKIILYVPTYRPNFYKFGSGYVYYEDTDFDKLRERLGGEYIILYRAHYLVSNKFDFSKYEGFVYNVSKVDDIDLLYIISDLMVTDYSSCAFDYAILQRPMIFYMYDLEHYKNESNGFYFDENELPGPIVKTQDELTDAIIELTGHFEVDEKYRQFNKKFNHADDGHAAEKVIDGFFFES